MPMLLIEGMDLAGKTTVANALVRELRMRGREVMHRRNFLTSDNPVGELADRQRYAGAEIPAVGALYVGAHVVDLVAFGRPPPGVLHVQESCWLRGVALHATIDRGPLPVVWAGLETLAPRFDEAVFITASLDDRRRRLVTRPDPDDLDHLVVRDPDLFTAIERELRRRVAARADVLHDLDTTRTAPDATLEALLRILTATITGARV